MTSNTIEIAQKLVVKDLNLEDPGITFSTNEKLTSWLAGVIGILIDRDFQRLMNILYRIDVDEHKIKEAFADDNPALKLAELVIMRELQKVESRKKYKS